MRAFFIFSGLALLASAASAQGRTPTRIRSPAHTDRALQLEATSSPRTTPGSRIPWAQEARRLTHVAEQSGGSGELRIDALLAARELRNKQYRSLEEDGRRIASGPHRVQTFRARAAHRVEMAAVRAEEASLARALGRSEEAAELEDGTAALHRAAAVEYARAGDLELTGFAYGQAARHRPEARSHERTLGEYFRRYASASRLETGELRTSIEWTQRAAQAAAELGDHRVAGELESRLARMLRSDRARAIHHSRSALRHFQDDAQSADRSRAITETLLGMQRPADGLAP